MATDLPEIRKRYEAVEEFLTDEERAHVESLRVRAEAGERVYYGHDLNAAVARGHRRRLAELADAALHRALLASHYGGEPDPKSEHHTAHVRVAWMGAVHALCRAAIEQGVPAEELTDRLHRMTAAV